MSQKVIKSEFLAWDYPRRHISSGSTYSQYPVFMTDNLEIPKYIAYQRQLFRQWFKAINR